MKQPIIGVLLGIIIQAMTLDFAKSTNTIENSLQTKPGAENGSRDTRSIQDRSPDLNTNNLQSESNDLVNNFTTETNKANWENSSQSERKRHSTQPPFPPTTEVEDEQFWRNVGFQEMKDSIDMQESSINTNLARNIILFIGDGMNNPTITAARIFKGSQQKRPYPEREYLFFERFPHLGRSKTFNVNQQTPDSASTASALYSGIKTIHDTLGYDSSIIYDNATSMLTANKVSNILIWAQEVGKDTGFVTSTRVTHATPAALYAHSANRDWECLIPNNVKDNDKVKDIAWQLINTTPGNKSKVILGGGFPAFYPRPPNVPRKPIKEFKANDYDYGSTEWDCYREDGQNLTQKWLDDKKFLGTHAVIVRSNAELQTVSANETDYLFGLFGETHIRFGDERVPDEDPSLIEMTLKAIEILQKSKHGFFLMVEGGRIDQAHHESWSQRALNATVELDLAVETALSKVNLTETLVIVTADHSHSMTFSGYAERGSDVTGLADEPLDDGLPYTLLSYGNGPGFYDNIMINDDRTNVTRLNLTNTNFKHNREYRYASAGWRDSVAHGGDDVSIFAIGPMSHLFSRTHDQTHIANVMAYSACIGPFADNSSTRCNHNSGSGSAAIWPLPMVLSFTIVIFLLSC